jgi:hypothetical protein
VWPFTHGGRTPWRHRRDLFRPSLKVRWDTSHPRYARIAKVVPRFTPKSPKARGLVERETSQAAIFVTVDQLLPLLGVVLAQVSAEETLS